ncbi:MAG: transposase [Candidatus Eisenbacteria sp.]|nr:transposase [Candidatus Eisenbacteria bacterium]
MKFTQAELKYFGELPSTVAHALPRAANPDVPFFLDDPVIRNYEMLRAVWLVGKPIGRACSSRTEYYRLEHAFLRKGIVAVYPDLGRRRQNPKLERLALLVKMVRPRATETMIRRFAEALGLEPSPSLRTIGHVLHCHGIGNTRNEEDRDYWHGIQESVRTLERLKAQGGPSRKKTDRKGTFYIAEESLQVRFELFRELAGNPREKVVHVVRRYGLCRATFYKYLGRFRHHGPWGLVDWQQPGHGRVKVSEELELKIIQEKLEHPRLSLDALVARMALRCSRTSIYEVLRYWDLLDKDRRPVRLRGFWREVEVEKPRQLLRTAKQEAEAGKFEVSTKVNAHFAHLLHRLKRRALVICDPGPIILAQFIDDLGICEALQLYGPKRGRGSEITSHILVNVCRILAGYETIGRLSENVDRSVSMAAGVGVFPGKTALYETFSDLKFEHLQSLRNDVAARARDLGLIRGERIAQDFHFKEFYGKGAADEEIGKGPNKAGELCPGFRPHVIWDLDTDVVINIAFCNGSSRATTVVREFCEKNLYPILGREAISEIYMDSEYTSFPVMDYFVVDEFSPTDVFICLKRNGRVDQLMRDVIAENEWEAFGEGYEIAGKRFSLENLGKELHFVVKRRKTTGDVRCFGTTVAGLENREVLERYRLRWPVENGIKDLVHSYFIDHILGKDPEKIEVNFYCVMVARLAYENFLQSLDDRFVRDASGYKKTLATYRNLLFARHSCELRLRGCHLELTYLDLCQGGLQSALQQLLERRSERGLNRVTWWGGVGLKVKFGDQYSRILGGKCTKNV